MDVVKNETMDTFLSCGFGSLQEDAAMSDWMKVMTRHDEGHTRPQAASLMLIDILFLISITLYFSHCSRSLPNTIPK